MRFRLTKNNSPLIWGFSSGHNINCGPIRAPSYQLFHTLSLSPAGLHLPPLALPRESKHASPREKERESVEKLIRGSFNGPQYIVTLLRRKSVAKHSIKGGSNSNLNCFKLKCVCILIERNS